MWSSLFQPKEAGSTHTQFLMIQSIRGMFVSTLHPPTEYALKTYKTERKCCLMRSVLKNRQNSSCLSDSFLRVYESEGERERKKREITIASRSECNYISSDRQKLCGLHFHNINYEQKGIES